MHNTTHSLLSAGKPLAEGSRADVKTLFQQAKCLRELCRSGVFTEEQVHEAVFGDGFLRIEKRRK